MVNTNPRRLMTTQRRMKPGDTPWSKGDPTKKVGLNTPIPEPLMLQLDWLVENKVIFSKASFIRDVVSAAAEAAITKHRRVQQAVKQIESEDRRRTT